MLLSPLSQYVDFFIKPFVQLLPSYIRDSSDFINPLGARFFFFKCWILTSRFQKLVAWKGLKIEIYCKLEKCWAWPKVYVGCKFTHLICILWRQQGGGPLEFHNIQEIVDIKLMFELICMFVCFFSLFILIPNDQEKRKSTVKREKVVIYYYITVP